MDRERSANDCLEWLQTRLAGDVRWAAATVSPFLTVATLRQVAACFRLLETGIKVKVPSSSTPPPSPRPLAQVACVLHRIYHGFYRLMPTRLPPAQSWVPLPARPV